ncbi:MAG TPA: hypothetical protein VMH87_01655 [Pseudomonadales bacterium]|nr:hypothetical protein [Pseudomonadales bacterium]
MPSLFLASNVFAGLTTTLDTSPKGYHDSSYAGGEFTALVSGGANYVANYSSSATATVNGQTGFETFCVEVDEQFSPGSTYNTSIGNTIMPGGAAIAIGTAYLYSQFAQGTLQGYNYNQNTTGKNSRAYTSDELQDAIWYLQGEITSSGDQYTRGNNYLYSFGGFSFDPKTDPFVKLVENMFGSNAFLSDSGNNYGVEVLELTDSHGSPVQDQLVYVPTAPPVVIPVPEPATFAAGAALLVPLGVSALRALRRKK